MIKGVSKQIVEINETGNEFFEKAIFFVKPEYSGASEARLRDSAAVTVRSAGIPPKNRMTAKHPRLYTALRFALAAAAGAFVTVLIMLTFR